MIDKYYEEELRYLYESGKEFANAHPDRARFLNIDAVGDRDPYVERLFEGFAFLAARIREKIDDSLPELSEGLVDMMWPSLLQEVPSLSIIEFRPRRGFLQESRVIDKGVELLTSAVGSESAVCRFSTTNSVRVHPIALTAIEKKTDTKRRDSLKFRFEVAPGIKWSKLSLSPLRLFLHAELPTALMLHEFLTGRAISCTIGSEDPTFHQELDPSVALAPGGLTREEALLPQDGRGFWGFSLLREYFVFPEKFLFVDLSGFERLPQMDDAPREVSVTVKFDREMPGNMPFQQNNFRLYCSPAVNLFERDTEPVVCSGLKREYPVIPDSSLPNSCRVHSIVSVEGIDRVTGQRSSYEPFHTFKNIGRKDRKTYSVQYRKGPDRKRRAYLALGGNQLRDGEIREENLSVQAWCSNGLLPREEVGEGGINRPGPNFPDFAMAANITRPTLPLEPPPDTEYPWMFLSHLGANYTTLASAETLKALLRVYNWSGEEGKNRRIDAITEVSAQPTHMSLEGSIVRGIVFKIHLSEEAFSDIDDIHLFGQVLREFLAQYVSINSYVELECIMQPSGSIRKWKWAKGTQWLV